MKCLDTDLLVAILRENPDAQEELGLLDEGGRNATTAVNAFEVMYGANKSKKREKNIEGARRLLSRLDVFPLDLRSADAAGRIFANLEKRGSTVEFRDVLVAAVAMEVNLSLVTRNEKHYSRIYGLEVEPW